MHFSCTSGQMFGDSNEISNIWGRGGLLFVCVGGFVCSFYIGHIFQYQMFESFEGGQEKERGCVQSIFGSSVLFQYKKNTVLANLAPLYPSSM